jgi:hypothetical protein
METGMLVNLIFSYPPQILEVWKWRLGCQLFNPIFIPRQKTPTQATGDWDVQPLPPCSVDPEVPETGTHQPLSPEISQILRYEMETGMLEFNWFHTHGTLDPRGMKMEIACASPFISLPKGNSQIPERKMWWRDARRFNLDCLQSQRYEWRLGVVLSNLGFSYPWKSST